MERKEVEKVFKKIWQYGDPRFYEIVIELCQLHNDKNKHYASKEDPLQNFWRVGSWATKYNLLSKGWEPLKVCLLYAMKQWDATLKLLGEANPSLIEGEGDIEGIEGRLDDIAVYSMLARVIYEKIKAGKLKW